MSLASTASADDLIGNLETSIAESLVPSGITPVWWIAPVCAIVALVAALICYKLMIKAPKGNSTMEEIAGYVREGAMAYLKQQYSRVGIVFLVLFVIFTILAIIGVQNPFVPVAFLRRPAELRRVPVRA